MKLLQRWNQTTIANQALVITGVLVAFSSLVYTGATIFQVIMLKQNAEETGQQTDRLIAASERLASTANTAVEDARKSNAETANRIERMTLANEELANATSKQANTSQVLARSAEIQTKTSQIAAKATEESARIARQSYESGQRPEVFFKSIKWREKPVANKTLVVEFVESNNGATAYKLVTEMSMSVEQSSFEGLLPYGPVIEDESPLERGADITLTTGFYTKLTEEGIKLLEDGHVLIFFYGHVWYEDRLGKKYSFSFCRSYDKLTYPSLSYCSKKIKVPEGTAASKQPAIPIRTLPTFCAEAIVFVQRGLFVQGPLKWDLPKNM